MNNVLAKKENANTTVLTWTNITKARVRAGKLALGDPRLGLRFGHWPRFSAQNAGMADELSQVYRLYEGLPVVGGLFRRQRREVERIASALIAAVMRDNIGLDAIVARLDIGEIVARLDIDAIVARLDIGEIVARLDIDAIVDRLDIDAVVARLDMNEVVARLDFSKLADQVVEDVDLRKVIIQAGTSVVRGRRPRNRI